MARIGRKSTLEWIKEDYRSNPVRFCREIIGMISKNNWHNLIKKQAVGL